MPETTDMGTLLTRIEKRLEQVERMSNYPALVAHSTLHDLIFALAGACLSTEQQEQVRQIVRLHSGYVLRNTDGPHCPPTTA